MKRNAFRILGTKQLHARLGAGRTPEAFAQWVYREESAGRFPKRVHISERVIGWLEHEIEEWEQRVLAARDGKAA